MPRLGSRVRIPSPAPRFPQIAELRQKPSGQQSCAPIFYTELLHNGAGDHARTFRNCSEKSRAGFYTKLLHNRPVGLVLVGRTYHYRRRVPVDVAGAIGRREIWRSLDTDSYAVAVRRIHQAATTVEAAFEQARQSLGRAFDTKLLEGLDGPSRNGLEPVCLTTPNLVVPDAATLAASRVHDRTISEVYDQFLADPKHTWSKRTTIAHETTRRWVTEVFGAQKPITDITREECRAFVDLLRRMPAHANKRFPDMTVQAAVAAAKKRGETRCIGVANLNAYLNRFGAVLNWATDEGYIQRNPARGLKLPDPVKKRDKRRPFSTDQLTRIFNAPIYTGCRDDAHHYAKVGSQRPWRARFWIPLIALYSGLRLNEICQLEVSDVAVIDGIPCFRVAAGESTTGEQKRVKTAASERIVPVHDELADFGFLAFAESQRLLGETNLFPELTLGHLGYRSTAFSQWFTRFLISAKATAPLTCFHSFRHCFRDALREAKVGRDLALILGGWTTEGNGSAISDVYGSGYRAPVLAEALNLVRYPSLDLSHLSVLR